MNSNINKLKNGRNTVLKCSMLSGLVLFLVGTSMASNFTDFALWADADGTNIICFGEENGEATVTPNDGVAPFSYQWSNGGNTQTITGLAPGEYEVTVTDAEGNTDTDIAYIFGPFAAMELKTSSNFATCGSSMDGKVNAEAKGGYTPYTYAWQDNAGNNYDGSLVDGLMAGTYNLTVTDANGCTITGEETIESSPEGIWIMTTGTDLTCSGDANGTAYAAAMSGDLPYTYLWSDPAMQTTQTATNLSGGIYFVTVTDANGCTGVERIKILEPLPLIFTITNITEADCEESNGMINTDLENGDYPVEFLWSDGQTGSTAINLAPGNYSVTVTDEGGCTASLTNLIIVDDCVPFTCTADAGTLTLNQSSPVCLENGSAVISATPNGDITVPGNYEITYVLTTTNDLTIIAISDAPEFAVSDPALYTIHTLVAETSDNSDDNFLNLSILNLGSSTATDLLSIIDGTNTCADLDASGASAMVENCDTCTADAGTLTLNQSSSVCLENGSAVISATPNGDITVPGNYEITYVLTTTNDLTIIAISDAPEFTVSDPALYTIHTLVAETSDNSDDNFLNLSILNLGSSTATNLLSIINGTNTCADLDASGTSVTVIICDTPCELPIIESLVIIEPNCNESNGTAVISLLGTETDFSYVWTPNVSNSNIAENIASGVYTVVIKNNSSLDCPSITETFSVANANGPMVEIVSTTPATCNEANGTATISPFGLVYTWCNGETGNNATSLMAGECFVTVTDTINNCTDVITVFIETVNPLMVELQVDNQPDCNQANGALRVLVGSGSFIYSYEWMDGSTESSRTDLPAGLYTVTVTDSGPTGCTKSKSIILADNVPKATVTLNAPVTTTCVGSDNGIADFTVATETGFALPVNVGISDINGNAVMNGNLAPGDYCISILDANGCLAGGTCFTVSEVLQIDLDVAILPEGCAPDGSITLTDLGGGNGGYTFDWSDLPGIDDPQNRTGLMAGIYNVTVTDAKGCAVVINGLNLSKDCNCQPPVLESVVIIEATCGNMDGSASVNVAGGSTGYMFSWSDNVGAGNVADTLSAGTYTVTITDSTDPTCMLIEIFTVGNSDGPQTEIATTPADCGNNNGTATLTPADYSYTWNDGSLEANRDDLNAGVYQVTIVDPANPECFDVQTVVIEETSNLMANVTINNNPDVGMSDGSATIGVTGGSGNYSYSWGMDATRDDLPAGLYAIIVTDLDTGCETRIIFVLNNTSGLAVISVSNISPVLCAGGNEGQIDFDLELTPDFNGPERIVIVDADGNTYQNGELPAGEYCALVYDINNVLTTSTCFVILPVPQIDLDLAIVDMTCLNPGGIEVVSTIGGSGDYNYEWSANANAGNDPLLLTNLEAGSYNLTLTDNNGCAVIENFDVSDDSYPLQVMLEGINVECDSTGNGAINSTVIGGEGMLNYNWSNEEVDANLGDLPGGNYTVTVTDENGCTGISTTTIEAPTPITFGMPADTMICTSPVIIGANTNLDGLVYSWTDANGNLIGDSEQVVLNLSGDNTEVFLTVVDSFGCTTVQAINIMSSAPEVALDDTTIACLGAPTQLSIDNLDPNDILSYTWEPAASIIDGGDTGSPTINITEPGNTIITGTVTNQFGCTTTVTSTIMVPDLTINLLDSITTCAGVPAALNNDANENLVYEWSPVEFLDNPTAPNPFVNAPAGTNEIFTVMISDSAGICSNTEIIDFMVPGELMDLEIPADNFICEAGEVTLNAGGPGVSVINYFDETGLQLGSGETISLPVGDVSGEVQTITIQYIDEFGCPSTETVNIGNATFALTILEEVSTCLGTPVNITSQTSLDMGIEFTNQWMPAMGIIEAAADSSDITVNPSSDQAYQLITTNEFGCSETATTEVLVTDLSDFVTTDTDRDTIFRGESAELLISESDEYTYLWEPANSLDDNTIANPEATPDETTTYTVTLTDGDGCTTTQRITITVLTPECNRPFIFFPNAFTPNNDGFNDMVYLRAAFSVEEVFFMIYTRWGEKVFESNSLDNGWDGRFKGKKLGSDVYAYYLRVRCANGDDYTEKGNITLLR